ncbi:MAG: T9SS type A sorting domain-containing protein [Bacteroidales bacterium]|nr:T9SS type A sorting domain-containing protein [Bacteroidales bacterium]
MKTKHIQTSLVIIFFICFACPCISQGIINNGAIIRVDSGNYLKMTGNYLDFKNKTCGNIDGVFDLDGHFSLQGDFFNQATKGAFNLGSNGNVIFNGSADQNIESNNFATIFYNFTTNQSSGAKLFIDDRSLVTIDNTLTLNDSLILEASSLCMSSLITNGTITGSKARVQEYLSQDQWHLVSSPVANATSIVYYGIWLKYFNEPDSTWIYIASTDSSLYVGKGYAVWSATSTSDTIVNFAGLLNTGDKNPPALTYNNNAGEGHGWNLIGNPYPSTLNWNNSWTKNNIDATIYVYDGSQYLTWNYNFGGFGTKTDGAIPSTQGFWVKANATNPSITMPNSERIHSSQSFYKNTNFINNLFKLKADGNGYSDITLIIFYNLATKGFDSEYDAYKIPGINAAPQLYSIIPAYNLAVNVLPFVDNLLIPLGFEVGVSTTYTITLTEVVTLNKVIPVYLEDLQEDIFINLLQNPVYEFTANTDDDPERFILHFYNINADNKENENIYSDVSYIYSYSNNIYIVYSDSEDLSGEAVIYDILGHEILRKTLKNTTINKITLHNVKGYYIVKAITNKGVIIEKIFLN